MDVGWPKIAQKLARFANNLSSFCFTFCLFDTCTVIGYYSILITVYELLNNHNEFINNLFHITKVTF